MIYTSSIETSIEMTGQYRYWLKRVWAPNKEIGVFIALNPSKATELKCDQTMCNINNLALQWGWGGFYILNLFAYMSTDKTKLLELNHPVGESNDAHIRKICSEHEKIIVAWGEEKPLLIKNRADDIRQILRSLNKEIFCLSENKSSGFKHPCILNVDGYPQPLKASI